MVGKTSPLLHSNDFGETKPVFTESNSHCTSLQSLRICLTQTAGGAVPVPPCKGRGMHGCLYCFLYEPHDCPPI